MNIRLDVDLFDPDMPITIRSPKDVMTWLWQMVLIGLVLAELLCDWVGDLFKPSVNS